jgi:Peptidase M15
MPLALAPTTGVPSAGLIERFIGPMRQVARTWAAVAATGIPVTITSWHRGVERNAAAGGQTYSQHLLGCAMDGVSPAVSQARLLQLAQSAATRFGTTAIVSERGAVHVQGLPNGMARAILTREPTLLAQAGTFIGPPRPVA